jgi:hypothetical protein
MRRATLCLGVMLVLGIYWAQSVSRAQSSAQPLVGTWLLTSEQLTAEGAQPVAAQGARGMLIFDGAGYYFELLDRVVPAALAGGLSDAQRAFYRINGSWGRYEVNRETGRIAFESFAGRSVDLTGARFSRTFAVASVPDEQDRLTTTSQPGELHTLAVATRVWQRVPAMSNLPPEARAVVGFWRHDGEGQKRADTGEVMTEVTRDPSVIVYTPSGFAGVHFPTRNRPGFAATVPTDAEARQQGNYLGYYASLGVYPGGRHQGLIFHNILGGGVTVGSTLRRFFDLRGDDVDLTFPAGTNRQGIRSQTYVKLHRLSNFDDMVERGRQ